MIGSLLHVVPLIFVCPYCVQEVLPILIFGKTNMEQLVSYVSCFLTQLLRQSMIMLYLIQTCKKSKRYQNPRALLRKFPPAWQC